MACPTPEQLELLARDALPEAQAAELRAHLAQCPPCRDRLQECRPDPALESTFAHVLAQVAELERRPVPHSFPGYEVVREIHRGGQGVVYQAIQKATKRKVALKVLHEGAFAGARDRARFEREIEILGQFNHPNIVGIHDSGTAGGHFFYAMDYISGQSLSDWMASRDRGIDECLRLFRTICDAVKTAHLRGVIHRDLKPSNICIDPSGEPHVLDFGLARTATGRVTDSPHPQVLTITGQFVGSLPWGSPEQAEGIPEKIDVRTDVYSLGVILYQMLTGKFPYDVVGNMRDVLDRIIQAPPVPPSSVRLEINDEVETIVFKCLSKERDRRYQNAGELARDVDHYLRGDPIEAKRDSALYVLRKQLQRYRGTVIASGALVLLVGLFGAAMAIQAANYRRLALSEAQAKEAARAAESAEREQRTEADRQRDAALGAEADAAFNAGVAYAQLAEHLEPGAERENKLKLAVRAYVRAIELDGGAYKEWYNLGCVRRQEADLANARLAFLEAAELKPHNPRPLANLAAMCFELAEYRESLSLYNRLGEMETAVGTWPLWASRCAIRLGDWPVAVAAGEAALQRNPKDASINQHRAWCYLLAPESLGRDCSLGLELALATEILDPQVEALEPTLALAYYRTGAIATATALAAKAAQLDAESVSACIIFSLCLGVQGSAQAAVEVYDSVRDRVGLFNDLKAGDEAMLLDEAEWLLDYSCPAPSPHARFGTERASYYGRPSDDGYNESRTSAETSDER